MIKKFYKNFGYYFNLPQAGSTLASVLTGVVIKATDLWSIPFYIYGALGLIWAVLFVSSALLDYFNMDYKYLFYLVRRLLKRSSF
jgi:hypothetical protein